MNSFDSTNSVNCASRRETSLTMETRTHTVIESGGEMTEYEEHSAVCCNDYRENTGYVIASAEVSCSSFWCITLSHL